MAPTSPSPSSSTTASSLPARDALRARVGELVAAGHEPLLRAAWPHGVAPLSRDGHTDDDLALILTAVRRVESDVSWPFHPDDSPLAKTAVVDESPPHPAPQLPDEGGDVDPASVAALQAAFMALPDAARQAIATISAEANAAGRPISVTAAPTVRRWSIARALVRWAQAGRPGDDLWFFVGHICESSQVTDADDTLGALISTLTISQANQLADTFDTSVAA